MYVLHIANKNYSSWSLRPWVLMTALGIPFEEKITPFPAAAPGRTVFRTFSPTGKVPCLIDSDTTVWDSLAIAEYLAERHPGVWPAEAKARAFARSASAEMHSGFQALRNVCGMNCGVRVKMPSVPAELEDDLARLSALWNDGLTRFGGPFLGGRAFTNVDAFFCPVAFRVQTFGLKLDGDCAAYAERLLALPAMKAWYEAGLAETWRIQRYEDDTRAAGEMVADFRTQA